jgi:peptide deformylase
MLKIRIYGDPVLRQKTKDVTVFDANLKALAEEMAAAMREAEGLGLSANQVGHPVNMFVLDWEALGKPLGWQAFVNPRIIEARSERLLDEGCLSFPGIRDQVKRYEKVRLQAQDLEGNPFEMEGEGLLAEAFQHEVDHLNGVVFTDRMPSGTRELLRRELRDLAKKGESARTRKADRDSESRGDPGL